MAFKNCVVSAAVQTATLGRSPVVRQCLTRAAVHTTARVRGAARSFTSAAGFSSTSPSRIAAFSAVRNVARIRFTVGSESRRRTWRAPRLITANISSRCDRQFGQQ
jgi:hypothetical protein